VVELDPWYILYALTIEILLMFRLKPFSGAIEKRYAAYEKQLALIDEHEGGLAHFSEGYKTMGLHVDKQGGVKYREWAPDATAARLIGDFSECLASHLSGRALIASRQLVTHRKPHDEISLWCLGVLCTSVVPWSLCHPTRLDGQNLDDHCDGRFH
jgi:hypothetical protein